MLQTDVYRNTETYLHTPDGTKIFFQSWIKEKSEYTIFITHGQGEHSNCYQRLIASFQSEPCSFYSFDFRGHGRSDGLRGYAKHPIQYVEDYETALTYALQNINKVNKLFLFSHSMGGLIQIIEQLQPAFVEMILPRLSGQILSSPLLGVSVPIPPWKEKASRMLNTYLPFLALDNEIDPANLTRDKNVQTEYLKDPLRHGKISAGVYLGFFDFFEDIRRNISKITMPTLLLLAKEDKVVSTKNSLEFFQNIASPKKESIIYPGATHELINDIIREEVFENMKGYLNKCL